MFETNTMYNVHLSRRTYFTENSTFVKDNHNFHQNESIIIETSDKDKYFVIFSSFLSHESAVQKQNTVKPIFLSFGIYWNQNESR